ncbi:hypothetical protein AB0P21_20915 [Kribbella sp. NPDC056861]|uniref:hypothetical protein n=1 Tax=Kribbella sp. NPDC056861 TaxID=3154857 RepID=UPI0034225BA9
MSLIFKVAELRNEIQAFRNLARDFIAPGADGVLSQAQADLENIARRSGGMIAWCIRPAYAFRTALSDGEYMPGKKKGGEKIHAEITFIWEIEPVRKKGGKQALEVRLVGKASTMVRLISGGPETASPEELAMWRMEVADDNSPGSYFHVQVLGREESAPFPSAIDVPRLPSVLMSPFACMEFALAELFQERWAKHAAEGTSETLAWRAIQGPRHDKQLAWHAEQIKSNSGSPWAAWKAAKPPEDLFNR